MPTLRGNLYVEFLLQQFCPEKCSSSVKCQELSHSPKSTLGAMSNLSFQVRRTREPPQTKCLLTNGQEARTEEPEKEGLSEERLQNAEPEDSHQKTVKGEERRSCPRELGTRKRRGREAGGEGQRTASQAPAVDTPCGVSHGVRSSEPSACRAWSSLLSHSCLSEPKHLDISGTAFAAAVSSVS